MAGVQTEATHQMSPQTAKEVSSQVTLGGGLKRLFHSGNTPAWPGQYLPDVCNHPGSLWTLNRHPEAH